MNTAVTKTAPPSFVAAMNADVTVGMNEVVSVFVAKYEDGLFAKKDELSKKIKQIKQEMTDLTARLSASVNKDQYVTTIPVLNMVSRVTSVEVNWKEQYRSDKNTIKVEVGVFDNGSKKDYAEFTKTFTFPISIDDVRFRMSLNSDLESLNAELMEVMGLIKSVSRKERQIRGRISEMKLAESGYSELMNNPEMLKLVQID